MNTGESIIKILTRVRMEQAAKLLKARPAEKVVDISEKVGYVRVKHFSMFSNIIFTCLPVKISISKHRQPNPGSMNRQFAKALIKSMKTLYFYLSKL
jgi:AraC-like DNA-binding protein